MDFAFTNEEEAFRTSVRAFCEEAIAPRAAEIDGKGEIPGDLMRAMGAKGLLAMTVSRKYGGAGAGFMKAAIAASEIARADASMAVAVYYLVGAGWGFLMDRYGTQEANSELLPRVASGESFLGVASTEAHGGSDIAGTTTTMIGKNGEFVINGAKAYISGVREAAKTGGGFVAVVSTDPGRGHKGLSLCYLPVKDGSGVAVSRSRQMGREGISNGFLTITDARIPKHYLIGEWNKGFYYAMEGFNCARALVAAACIGAAEKALETGVDRIKKRKVFGQAIGKYEGIQFQLAENYAKLESARLIVYKAAWALDRFYGTGFDRGELNRTVALAKFTAPQTAFEVIKNVMVWHGAYGYTREAGLERGLRGVVSYLVGAEGAMNIMRLIIGRELLGKDF